MPRYDYRCVSCDHVFEVTRAAGAGSDECCPQCGSGARRVFTPVGVVFKGSGFHNTDYRPTAPDAAKQDAPAPSTEAPACGGGCSGCPAAE